MLRHGLIVLMAAIGAIALPGCGASPHDAPRPTTKTRAIVSHAPPPAGRYAAGRSVAVAAGCLACHTIGRAGGDGPGPDLSDIAERLPPLGIARELRHPTAPMPSYGSHPPKRFRALVAYLAHLRLPARRGSVVGTNVRGN
jgi:ubiquinol-cytochrome c reductase cytochrome b subunit/menaquinol-cytochrome c reductase cytochrome b/c subunit